MSVVSRCALGYTVLTYVDYIPLVSTVSAIVALFIKIHAHFWPSAALHHHIYTYFVEKNCARISLAAFPVLGNIWLFWSDRQKAIANSFFTPQRPYQTPQQQTPLPPSIKSYTWSAHSLYSLSPEEAFAACEQASLSNKPAAWYLLGLLYERGHGTLRDAQQAQACFAQAQALYASFGALSEDDEYIQAMMCYFGKGCTQNTLSAYNHILKIIQNPHSQHRQALYLIGTAYLLDKKTKHEGLRYLKRAQQLYEQLPNKSVYDYLVYIDIQKIRSSQNDQGNSNRSLSYINIENPEAHQEIEEQYKQVALMCQKQENIENMHALFVLGVLEDPRFNPQGNIEKCKIWYRKAVAKGHFYAHIALAKALAAAHQTETNRAERRELLQKEIFQEESDALFELAITYPKTAPEFQKYMDAAAQFGHKKAQQFLDFQRISSQENLSLRQALLEKADLKTDPEALFSLARTFPETSDNFQEYMQQAALLNHQKAQLIFSRHPILFEELALRELAIFP